MIILVSLIGGALFGAYRAKRRKGSGFDIAQYAVAHAIAFGLLGVLVTVVIARMA